MTQKIKSTLVRFAKVFCFSGFGAMATLATFTGNSWKDLATWLSALSFSFVVGGISGVIAGYEKWANWTE